MRENRFLKGFVFALMFILVLVLVINFSEREAKGTLPAPAATPEKDTGQTEALEKSLDEMNGEIRKIADKKIAELKKQLEGEGYEELGFRAEVTGKNRKYVTLKISSYESMADGYEENYFYTIDLNTGKRLLLQDLFRADSDYIRVISENIKQQMRKQMESDESASYWLDDPDFPEDNFKTITPDTKFYINEQEEIVICFDEGDVAPMFMGTVEFVIPKELTEGMKK